MQKRTLGTSEIQITPIIFGGWQSGKYMWVGVEDTETIAAHKAAFNAGVTTFDTAEVYGDGHSEQILGKALGEVRDQIVILSKVAPTHLKYDNVIAACHRSLKNLGTEYIDLYQIHWPSGSFGSPIVPIQETMAALAALKDEGKIRAIGVSNFSRSQIIEASKFGKIESIQPSYSLFWRQAELELQPYAVEHKLSLIAYSPLAQGLLTGKFGRDHVFADGDHRVDNKLFSGDNFARAQDALDKLRPLADKYNITLGQLALGWLIAQPRTSAIVGARNADQAAQNAKAAQFELSVDDITTIDEIGRTVTDHLGTSPAMWTWA
jgi:aryl-alcohol dehydrogenase-like predicted oxidoreductase